MTSVCASATDFSTDGSGRLTLKANYREANMIDFVHTLSGADDVYELIGAAGVITIPNSGIWVITAEVHGIVSWPDIVTAAPVEGQVLAALYRNGVRITGSETQVIRHFQDGPNPADQEFPSGSVEGTGAVTRFVNCAAGDLIHLYGARTTSANPATTQIVSESLEGRTRLMAFRIGV